MQINISTRHGHLSSATQEKIEAKVAKLTRFFDRVTSIEVTVDLGHRENADVEVRVTAEHSADFVARDHSSNVLAALDSVLQKLENQLRKHKEKLTGHRSPGLKHLEVPQESESENE